jgi:putative ABC transport system ATP-binding protein
VIELRDVGYRIQGRQVLSGVSLQIEPGQSVALTGPSGSGKSTLLAVMAGLVGADTGSVRLDARHTGIVFQGYGLLSLLTAAENVELAQQAQRVPRAQIARDVPAALEAVGLLARADHLLEELSGGEQQRVAVARALVGRPDVVLADEPTAELDETNRARITSLLLDVATTGRIMVIATHDIAVASLCSRHLAVSAGTVRPA